MLPTLRRVLDSPWMGVLAAAGYGGWALLANLDGGWAAAWRAAALHGVLSALLTLAGVRLVAAMYRWFHHVGLAVLGSLAATYAGTVGAHMAIGTPHVLLTLLPGLLPTIAFTVGYAWLVSRTRTDKSGVHA